METIINKNGNGNMNKEQAIELLKKEDIERLIKEIKDNNLKVVYFKSGMDDEVNLWYINNDHLYDYLQFYFYTNLHWTVLFDDLIKAIKQEIDYIIE